MVTEVLSVILGLNIVLFYILGGIGSYVFDAGFSTRKVCFGYRFKPKSTDQIGPIGLQDLCKSVIHVSKNGFVKDVVKTNCFEFSALCMVPTKFLVPLSFFFFFFVSLNLSKMPTHQLLYCTILIFLSKIYIDILNGNGVLPSI